MARAVLQASDGHLVLYDHQGRPQWATGVFGAEFAGSNLILENDGSLVIYTDSGNAIWTSGTMFNPNHELRRSERERVGEGKIMETTATLYRNGQLTLESYQDNDVWTMRSEERSWSS